METMLSAVRPTVIHDSNTQELKNRLGATGSGVEACLTDGCPHVKLNVHAHRSRQLGAATLSSCTRLQTREVTDGFCMQIFNKYHLNALNKHAATKIMSLQSNLLLFLADLLQVKQMLSRQAAAKTFA